MFLMIIPQSNISPRVGLNGRTRIQDRMLESILSWDGGERNLTLHGLRAHEITQVGENQWSIRSIAQRGSIDVLEVSMHLA
jgi:hypothetical protein